MTWTFYKKVEKNGKQRALRNQCMTDIVPLVERMKEHYQKCKAPSAAEDDVSESEFRGAKSWSDCFSLPAGK